MSDPLPRILNVDFDKAANVWVIQLQRADNRRCSVKLRPDAFEYVRAHPLGQVLLQMWFSKAVPVPEKRPTP